MKLKERRDGTYDVILERKDGLIPPKGSKGYTFEVVYENERDTVYWG
jgi:hypothetical protein